MNKHRFFRILALLTAVTMIWGCAAPPATAPATQPPQETQAPPPATPLEAWGAEVKTSLGGTEIKVAVASHPSIEAFKKMTPDFEALTGIKVVWDEMEEGALADKLLLESSSGTTSYDALMNCPEFTPALADLGYLENLDPYLKDPAKTPVWFDYEDIMAAYRDMLSYGGQHLAIPFAGETVFLFYNKEIFEKHGLKVPTTMDELLETARQIQEKEPGMAGISMRTRLGWEFTYMWSVFIFPFGGMIVDPKTNTAMLKSPGTLKSLEFFNSLAAYGPTGITSYSFPEAWDAFMQGKAGMMVEASAAAPEVENPEKSLVAGKVGYAPMPAGPEGAYSGVWGWGFSMTSQSAKKDAAWAFITYMTGKATQQTYIANGGVVSRSSELQDPQKQAQYPYYQAILETLKQAAALQEKGLGVVLPTPLWSMISEVMGTEGSRALTGEIDAKTAVESMQKQVEDILSQ